MKVSCDVIQDLLPLYIEKLASEDSIHLIETHLATCVDCQKLSEEMDQPDPLPKDIDTGAFLKIKSVLRRKKLKTGILTFLLTAVFLLAGFSYLTSPQYLPYSKDLIKVTEDADGSVFATLGGAASRFEIEQSENPDQGQFEYNIMIWTSTLDQLLNKGAEHVILLNPNRENVESVWFVNPQSGSEDGTVNEDVQLLGSRRSGGRITLPRLFFSFYLMVAGFILSLCLVLLGLFRKHERSKNLILQVAFLPISYLIAHFIVKGLTLPSYQSAREFYNILLIAIPLFAVFQLAFSLFKESNLANRSQNPTQI